MTPSDDTPTSDATRILANANEQSRRLRGAVSVREGWWTIGSAALVFVITFGVLQIGQGVGYEYLLIGLPASVIVARYRRSAERVHPRRYQRWYALASAWCLVVSVTGFWYWLLRDPHGSRSLWATCAVALVAALPLVFVGARLVTGGRSR